MMWFVVALSAVFFAAAFVALAISGAETPREIQTFSRATQAERQFDRRSAKLQKIGVLCLSLAMAGAAFAYFH